MVRRVVELLGRHPRHGYRRIWALVRREGWQLNRKRVYRLPRQQGLTVPRKPRKKRLLGSSANDCARWPARHQDHVWAWDLLHDRTADGRAWKWLALADKYTASAWRWRGRGMRVQAVLALGAARARGAGAPAVGQRAGVDRPGDPVRDGPGGVETLYIAPWAPRENGYAEAFNGKVWDELLNVEEFTTLLEARVLGQVYNQQRPHSGLGYATPTEYAAGSPRPAFAAPAREPDLRG